MGVTDDLSKTARTATKEESEAFTTRLEATVEEIRARNEATLKVEFGAPRRFI